MFKGSLQLGAGEGRERIRRKCDHRGKRNFRELKNMLTNFYYRYETRIMYSDK